MLNADEMAETLGITRRTLSRWVRAGCPHEGGGAGRPLTFDRAAVIAWMTRTGASGLPGRPPEGTRDQEGEQDTGDDTARISKLAKLVSLEIKRLEAARRKRIERIAEGELHDAVDCQRSTLQKIYTVRAGLLSLPAKLSARLVGRQPHEIEQEITREVYHLLAQFAGQVKYDDND